MIIGSSGRGRSVLTSLMAASMVRSLEGWYGDAGFPKMSGIKHSRNVPQFMPKKEQPRNERCNCGSGIKYKNCCGK